MYEQPHAQVQPPLQAPVQQRGNWMAVTGLVIGIVSLVLSWVPVLNVVMIFTGLIGLGFAIAGLVGARSGQRAGKGMSIVSIVLAVLAITVSVTTAALYASMAEQIATELKTQQTP